MILADTPSQQRKRDKVLARARKDLERFRTVDARPELSEADRALARLVIEQLEAAIAEPHRLVTRITVGADGLARGYL